MDDRRAAALARIERVRKEIAAAAEAERKRAAEWEKRLREATEKRPIPIRQFGLDWDKPVRIARFDGRIVTFAGDGFELGFALEDLPKLRAEWLAYAKSLR